VSRTQWIPVQGRRIEYRWFDPQKPIPGRPSIVMLHEGLGSLSMWKSFPDILATITETRVVAYSRFGYGDSDAPAPRPIATRKLEEEALNVLPEILCALGIQRPVLFGHSDGASIALIYSGAHPDEVSGIIAMAPHVFVEDMCIASIENARQAYLETNLRERLAPYHRDPDGAFWQWNRLWLDPEFRAWNIEHYLPSIRSPLLLIQGHDDEYGTMEQIERIVRRAKLTETLRLAHCRHSPHRDQTGQVLAAARRFIEERICRNRVDVPAGSSLPSG
jgi:pimeloyl-ACP methyl ester carboxylesterase